MQIALVASSLLDRSWDKTLDTAISVGIRVVEPSAGGHIPKVHYDPVHLASSDTALAAFRATVEGRGMSICSFSCHGNPLHPNRATAERAHEDFVATCEIASRLDASVVSVLAGTPGGCAEDKTPNWIFNAGFIMYKGMYKWQWEERVIPYWTEAVKIAEKHKVRIGVEPHPGDTVYNTQTFLRLREAVGPTLGMTLDPSGLWWQGIDPVVLIETVGSGIHHCHIKDVTIDWRRVAREGLLPCANYDDFEGRSWNYSTAGYGHEEGFWRKFLIALRKVGYDGPLSIEVQDANLTVEETLEKTVKLLDVVMPHHPRPTVNWMDAYRLDDYDKLSASQTHGNK